MCSLRFENNLLTIEGVHFASISKKTPLSKLSFAFVSLALPLLTGTHMFDAQGTDIIVSAPILITHRYKCADIFHSVSTLLTVRQHFLWCANIFHSARTFLIVRRFFLVHRHFPQCTNFFNSAQPFSLQRQLFLQCTHLLIIC